MVENHNLSSTDEDKEAKQSRIILVAKRGLNLRVRQGAISAAEGIETNPLIELLQSNKATIKPLFHKNEDRLKAESDSLTAATGKEVPDLSIYYSVESPESNLEELASQLRSLDVVDTAYIKPSAKPASMLLNTMTAKTEEPPTTTPNFVSRQGYLDPAPVGIDAKYAWSIAGGYGNGVNIIDIEWGWHFTHEDLRVNHGGVISGTNSSNDDHGTSVIGEFGGDANNFGVTGISPEAYVSTVSLETHDTSEAILIAADRLRPGDIMLLEVHRDGPASIGVGQYGYIAIEWWPDDFDAIRYAVSKGIIVVEAAGNGGQNLDDNIYNTPQAGFPTSWRNPFNPNNPTSGAILVGAGNPPSGIHGRNAQPNVGEPYADRARCYFSNYGERVDTQGWGWEVTSTGYGDLQGGTSKDVWYTDQFSGTSSASPIIVGTLACLQGILRANGKAPLNSSQAIKLLRSTGSPQQRGSGFTFSRNMSGTGYTQNYPERSENQRIGNRPNLRELIEKVL